jgi:hypothetical protein
MMGRRTGGTLHKLVALLLASLFPVASADFAEANRKARKRPRKARAAQKSKATLNQPAKMATPKAANLTPHSVIVVDRQGVAEVLMPAAVGSVRQTQPKAKPQPTAREPQPKATPQRTVRETVAPKAQAA